MKSYNKEVTKFFDTIVKPEDENFTSLNIDITMQVVKLLKEMNWSQKTLAKKMGKSEAELSKWLSGAHNLTLKSIAKIQVAIGRDIVTTPERAKDKYYKVKYVTLKIHANSNDNPITTDFHDYKKSGQLFKKAN